MRSVVVIAVGAALAVAFAAAAYVVVAYLSLA